jgi:hypothetical protein
LTWSFLLESNAIRQGRMNQRHHLAKRIAALLLSFAASIWLPLESGQDIDWQRIREAFRIYSAKPSTENAERIIAVLPNKFDYRNVNQKEWELTLNYLDMINGEPFRVLANLIRQGDESAIRVAFKTHIITDGAVTEDLLEILSEAIRANTLIFLEELDALKKYDEHSVEFLLSMDGDIDTYTLFDDPQARAEFNKEIVLRIKSLRTVTCPDLVEIRNYCINYYEELLKEGK